MTGELDVTVNRELYTLKCLVINGGTKKVSCTD